MGEWYHRIADLLSGTRSGDLGLLSKTQLARELNRERLRAVRRELPFCLLLIRLSGRQTKRHDRRQLSRLLQRAMRKTDVKGQLDHDAIGVLLVDTAEPGGRSAAERLEGLLATLGLRAELDVRQFDAAGFPRSDDFDDWDAPSTSDSPPRAQMPPVPGSNAAAEAVKRGIDIAGAIVGLVLAAPVIVLAAIAIRTTSPGPALFGQRREGRYGRPFTIYKLRTMVVDAEQQLDAIRSHSERDGPAFKMSNDPRVTRLGRWLRSTCLDELPQLWNVLRGDMSLVGPRPLPIEESRACQTWQRRRLDIRPGLTCVWQIDKRRAENFDHWMRMDLNYVDGRSLWQDFSLLARTVSVPLQRRGGE
ncbi:sugar transferase [Roseimaritima ulvae]|uniref:Undecaprenyl-phosphate N-acetylgalactosaminyl 1-phosphate transferase n=1 Tax=Roseimaritima ulvae TaxID=980254 RepID=A0A5B9QMR4_9BACT|nr:sugar transferase [Roseimaritima ulvae]QEG40234.1 Putative undecaprenyl-phosphate N-acetylgalactosaminyl 1-phosphate transferase [Roseimaritima ulvae]